MAARHEEWCYEENILICFLGCNGLSNDDIEVERGTVFREIRPGTGFKTGDFVEEKLGGGGYRRTTHGSGRVGRFRNTRYYSRVESGRVGRCSKSHGSLIGSGVFEYHGSGRVTLMRKK